MKFEKFGAECVSVIETGTDAKGGICDDVCCSGYDDDDDSLKLISCLDRL